MKTRREFMRFTLGSMACLGAAIVAPKVLRAQKRKSELPEVTSGYAQIGTMQFKTFKIEIASTDGFKSGDAWRVINND